MLDFSPQDTLSDSQRDYGMKITIRDGVSTQIMMTATEGIFLISFALLLGASNTFIGIIAALPFFSQLTQIFGIIILERWKVRRKIVALSVCSTETDKKLSDRKHICSNPDCGYEVDRDYNASLNILHIAYHRQGSETDDRSQGLTSLPVEENPLLSMISAKEVIAGKIFC